MRSMKKQAKHKHNKCSRKKKKSKQNTWTSNSKDIDDGNSKFHYGQVNNIWTNFQIQMPAAEWNSSMLL